MGSMAYIRKTYGVPAKRGMRVEFTGCRGVELGTITSATSSGHLKIRLDRSKQPAKFHPTWELRYLPSPPAAQGARQPEASNGAALLVIFKEKPAAQGSKEGGGHE